MGRTSFAVEEYLKAIRLMPEQNEFLAMIYDNLAECYEEEDFCLDNATRYFLTSPVLEVTMISRLPRLILPIKPDWQIEGGLSGYQYGRSCRGGK